MRPSLASSLNHAALNVANALGAFLGGLVIAWGWGYVAPALVGAVLAVLGLGVAVLSGTAGTQKAAGPVTPGSQGQRPAGHCSHFAAELAADVREG